MPVLGFSSIVQLLLVAHIVLSYVYPGYTTMKKGEGTAPK